MIYIEELFFICQYIGNKRSEMDRVTQVLNWFKMLRKFSKSFTENKFRKKNYRINLKTKQQTVQNKVIL